MKRISWTALGAWTLLTLAGCGDEATSATDAAATADAKDAVSSRGPDSTSDTVACPPGHAVVADGCQFVCQPHTCTAGKWCDVGAPMDCTPVVCDLPQVPAPRPAWKVTALRILPTAQGCDLDDDGTNDNELGELIKLDTTANPTFAKAIAAGEMVRLFEAATPTTDGKPFQLSWLEGERAPDDASCDLASATAKCKIWLHKQSFDLTQPGACKPRSTCEATWDGAQIQMACAGVMPQPVNLKPEMTIPGYGVKLKGTLSAQTQAGTLQICGYYRMDDLLERLAWVPADKLAECCTLAGARDLLKSALKPDLDTDKDGTMDGVSFAAEIDLGPAAIVGQVP